MWRIILKNIFKGSILPFVYGALLIILGILIIVFPAFWVKLFVVVFGICSIAYGIYTLLPLKDLESSQYKTMSIVKGLVNILFGILSVIIPIAVAKTTWKVIVYIFAVELILSSAVGFYLTSIVSLDGKDRKRAIFENVFMLLAAIILFLISPEKLGNVIIRIIGVCTILVGIVFIVIRLTSKKDIVVTDVEVRDAPTETAESTASDESATSESQSTDSSDEQK